MIIEIIINYLDPDPKLNEVVENVCVRSVLSCQGNLVLSSNHMPSREFNQGKLAWRWYSC